MGAAKKYKGAYLKTRLFLLVQKTLRGELASRIREQLLRFEPILLDSKSRLWREQEPPELANSARLRYGRGAAVAATTVYHVQEAKEHPDCTKVGVRIYYVQPATHRLRARGR